MKPPMKSKLVPLFIFLSFLVLLPAKGQVFSTQFEPDWMNYGNVEDTKYEPKYTLSFQTQEFFLDFMLDFRKRGMEDEVLDKYYSISGGSEVGGFGFRSNVLRATNAGEISDFVLWKVEAFKQRSGSINLYPTYEFRYYDKFDRTLNNIGLVVTRRTDYIFTKTSLAYEFETSSFTPIVTHEIPLGEGNTLTIEAASDSYLYEFDPFGPSKAFQFDDKYITGKLNTEIGRGVIEVGVEGGYFEQAHFGESFFFGANVHFNMIFPNNGHE